MDIIKLPRGVRPLSGARSGCCTGCAPLILRPDPPKVPEHGPSLEPLDGSETRLLRVLRLPFESLGSLDHRPLGPGEPLRSLAPAIQSSLIAPFLECPLCRFSIARFSQSLPSLCPVPCAPSPVPRVRCLCPSFPSLLRDEVPACSDCDFGNALPAPLHCPFGGSLPCVPLLSISPAPIPARLVTVSALLCSRGRVQPRPAGSGLRQEAPHPKQPLCSCPASSLSRRDADLRKRGLCLPWVRLEPL